MAKQVLSNKQLIQKQTPGRILQNKVLQQFSQNWGTAFINNRYASER